MLSVKSVADKLEVWIAELLLDLFHERIDRPVSVVLHSGREDNYFEINSHLVAELLNSWPEVQRFLLFIIVH